MIDKVIQKKILQELVNAFGGRFYEVIIGGAAFNPEVERFFRKIGFPFTVGYGMTECAPIIGYADWKDTKLYSCGKAAMNMSICIGSSDPKNIPEKFWSRDLMYSSVIIRMKRLPPKSWTRTGGSIQEIWALWTTRASCS